jgi:anti-sigma factor RsiW
MATPESSYETIVAYVLGELRRTEAADFESNLATNPALQASVARVRGMLDGLRSDDSVAPPARAVAAAKAIHARFHVPQPSWLQQLARSMADMIFDSRAQPALVGLRGDDETVQLSFDSALATIDLQVESHADESAETLDIMGQVNPRQAVREMQAALVEPVAGVAVGVASMDESGVFRIQTRPGEYDLVIRLDDAAVVLPKLEIG